MGSRKCQELILESRNVVIDIEQRACREGELQKTSKMDQLRISETEVRFRTHAVCVPSFTTRNSERRSQYCQGGRRYVSSRNSVSTPPGSSMLGTATQPRSCHEHVVSHSLRRYHLVIMYTAI